MNNFWLPLINLGIACFFILSLRGLTFPRSAYRSNQLGICGMCLALLLSLLSCTHPMLVLCAIFIGTLIGMYIAQKVQMTDLPQTVAIFNGLGGLAAFLVACCVILENNKDILDTPISAVIGIFTFSGSCIAFAKLQGLIKRKFNGLNPYFNLIILFFLLMAFILYAAYPQFSVFAIISGLAFILGIMVTLRIGGADMPIVISLLNAGSGLDSAALGFVLGNPLLIITGALIGVSGCILSYIMCKAMNRPLLNVLFGSRTAPNEPDTFNHKQVVKTGSPAEAAFIMENARKIIIVPGYGMAVAQAQHILKQMAEVLHNKYNADVKFAIHPVAGRMPGHMNVLLAEADVPYENIFGLNDINNDFAAADVAYVIGANDITNPLAKTDENAAIFGMPILDVGKAKTVFVVKRTMGSGYTGLDNPLFYADNTIMLFGDAQKVTAEIVKFLEH